MKKMIMALPLLVMLSCSSSRNSTTGTAGTVDDGTGTTGTTAMSGDISADASGTASTTGTTGTTGTTSSISTGTTGSDVYVSGSATTSSRGDYNSTGNGRYDAWTSNPRNNWYNRNNTDGSNWESVYWGDDMTYDAQGNMRDTSALYGSWQLTMTPDLVSAWRNDYNELGYVFTGMNTNSQAYVSGSATVGGQTGVNGTAGISGTTSGNTGNNSSTLSGSTSGSVSGSAGTTGGSVSASGNTGTSGSMSGTSGSTTGGSVSANGNLSGTGTSGISGSTTGGSVSASGNMGTTGTPGSQTYLSGSAVTYGSPTWGNTNGASPNIYAANGNMYMMPRFNLYLNNGSFTGFTGCNNISGRLMVSGNMLHFENTTPATAIQCLAGFDQSVLLDRLRRIDNYVVNGNQLQLRQGDQVLLTLDKNSQGMMQPASNGSMSTPSGSSGTTTQNHSGSHQ